MMTVIVPEVQVPEVGLKIQKHPKRKVLRVLLKDYLSKLTSV